MLEVQKKTYLDIILSNTYSNNSFLAKSITLDFLFGFYNPYTAIVTLNECLSGNNLLAKIGLNCIYGILLAVKEYREFCQTTIIYEFVRTLINVMTYKIDDVQIENYRNCMENILQFIAENVDFKLIILFFDLANSFLYCEGNNKEREAVFDKYCNVLDFACKELKKKDSQLLCYNLLSIKTELLNEKELSKNNILSKVNNILRNIYEEEENRKSKIQVVSNVGDKAASLVNGLQKNYQQLDIDIVEKERLKNIQQVNDLKILFLIDFKNNDVNELIYLIGMMEGKLEQSKLFVCFYNCEVANTDLFYKTLIDRYASEDNLNNRLAKFLQ